MELVPIQAGSFLMGSENGDSDEKPVHRVTLTKPFWLGKFEVTQAQYEALISKNRSEFKGARNPVECVSWNDAVEFCRKLTERERAAGRLPSGYEYRLPTEAEWEYGCRAGTTSDYAGDLDQMAWYAENSGGRTHEVGTKQPNAWGLHDMHGNVWEWCLDWYDEGYYARLPNSDPVNTAAATNRVKRGGSWFNVASYVRSAFRNRYWPDGTYIFLGFRACLAPQSEGR
jgi:formylglycine-generating enzyme required for sulfatase activity